MEPQDHLRHGDLDEVVQCASTPEVEIFKSIMGLQFELLPGHGLTVITAIASVFITVWAGVCVGSARKKFKVRYPTMYADKSDTNAEAFNCYQRAHQNILENYPQFLVLLALASVHRPIIAAIAGAIRLMGFVSYALGYQTGDPDKRLRGTFGYIGLLTLLGLSIELAVRLLAS